MSPPELLAPAGDWDALRAACANGADAVYFGLSAFNARHRAANFTPDELPAVIDFLHARNVRGFVTLNTLIFSGELERVADYVRLIAAAGTDAVIVQDLGLARLIARLAPGLHVHASTQMTLTEPRGVEWAREHLNIRRAVLARELSVADVKKVAEGSSVPLEVFVHGALCVAYSGQCLTSEALGGRSANRGQCAQACRLPYELVADGEVKDLGDRAYLLSPQDLAAHEFVPDLIDAGVVSFKVEGRLKGPHYVAATTRAYRDAIDAAVARRPVALTAGQKRDLDQTFSRGFTPGFLEGPNHQRLVRGRVPKSRGLCVGTVVARSGRGIRVALTDVDASVLAAGDGVVFDV
ncbi:MAG TPA: peptidase U32 family protein, partial [Gemmataceae bacterium]|nr:peptidase U32 family protein [Gemmataceae bacterium]